MPFLCVETFNFELTLLNSNDYKGKQFQSSEQEIQEKFNSATNFQLSQNEFTTKYLFFISNEKLKEIAQSVLQTPLR